MKKIFIVTSLLIAFSVMAVLIGCTSNKQNPQITIPSPNTGTNNIPNTNKTFTVDELKKYTGQGGNPAYVAVNGTVYDVTNARKWRNGKHQQGVVAGVDLTNIIGESPHGTSVLSQVPAVGTLK